MQIDNDMFCQSDSNEELWFNTLLKVYTSDFHDIPSHSLDDPTIRMQIRCKSILYKQPELGRSLKSCLNFFAIFTLKVA